MKVSELAKNILEAYFRPKKFETQKLYQRLGIKVYLYFLPTAGTLCVRIFHLQGGFVGGKKDLMADEQSTRWFEGIHLVGFVIGLFLSIWDALDGGWWQALGWTVSNVLINLYGMMLQRWKRIRLARCIRRLRKPREDAR